MDSLSEFVDNLNDDDAVNFLVQMPVDIICKFETCSGHLAKICADENLWQRKINQDFAEKANDKPSDTTWRTYYEKLITK